MGSQTVTEWQWRAVWVHCRVAETWDWRTDRAVAERDARSHVDFDEMDAVYLEKRTVTYGPVVRVELDEGSGDAV